MTITHQKKITASTEPAVRTMKIIVKSGISSDGFKIVILESGKPIFTEDYRYGYNASYDRSFAKQAHRDVENAKKYNWTGYYIEQPYVSDIIDDLCKQYGVDKNNIQVSTGMNTFKGDEVSSKKVDEFINKYLKASESITASEKYRCMDDSIGDKGSTITREDLEEMYYELKGSDPVVSEYDTFEEWLKDTVDNGYLRKVSKSDKAAVKEDVYEDVDAIFYPELGHKITLSELKEIYEELKDEDTVVGDYDTFDAWLKDTIDSGYLRKVNASADITASEKYKGYFIVLDRGGDGYNVYNKNQEIEEEGIASLDAAKKFVDEITASTRTNEFDDEIMDDDIVDLMHEMESNGVNLKSRRDVLQELGANYGFDRDDQIEILHEITRYLLKGWYESFNTVESSEEIDDDLETAEQEFTSKETSINKAKLPAIYKMVNFPAGSVVIDYGGGKYDNGSEFLAEKDCTGLVYDPFNRTADHNREVVRQCKANGGADIGLCANVLNVIKEPEARLTALRNISKLVKPGGDVYFIVYEGNGSGQGGQSQDDAYQLNRKTKDYLEEIQQVFPDAKRKGKLIFGTNTGSVSSSEKIVCDVHGLEDIKDMFEEGYDGHGWFEDEIELDQGDAKNLARYLSDLGYRVKQNLKKHFWFLPGECYWDEDKFYTYRPDPALVYSATVIDDFNKAPTGVREVCKEISDDLYNAAAELMQSPEFGFPLDEIADYLVVEVNPIYDDLDTKQKKPIGIKAEVRAEMTYEGMSELKDVLDPIVQLQDPDAYFDHVTGGIIDAYMYFPKYKKSLLDDVYDEKFESSTDIECSEDDGLRSQIYQYLNEAGGYLDYNQRIEDVAEDFGLDKDTAEGYVADWAQGSEYNDLGVDTRTGRPWGESEDEEDLYNVYPEDVVDLIYEIRKYIDQPKGYKLFYELEKRIIDGGLDNSILYDVAADFAWDGTLNRKVNELAKAEGRDDLISEDYIGSSIKTRHTNYCPHCTNMTLVEVDDGYYVCEECGAEYEGVPAFEGGLKLEEIESSSDINLPAYAVEWISGYAGNGVNRTEVKYFRSEDMRDSFVNNLYDRNAVGIKKFEVPDFYHTAESVESSKNIVAGELVDTPQEVIDDLLKILNEYGFILDDRFEENPGRTWMGEVHIQVINPDSYIDTNADVRAQLQKYVPRDMRNKIHDLERGSNCPITWNFGVDKKFHVTGGLDIMKQWVPDPDDELVESVDAAESINSASYGGAYDIEDDVYFTKDEIMEFANMVCDSFNEWASPDVYDVEAVYFIGDQPNTLEMCVSDGDYDLYATQRIDMRKIRKPDDIKKYASVFKKQLQDAYQEYHPSYEDAYDDGFQDAEWEEYVDSACDVEASTDDDTPSGDAESITADEVIDYESEVDVSKSYEVDFDVRVIVKDEDQFYISYEDADVDDIEDMEFNITIDTKDEIVNHLQDLIMYNVPDEKGKYRASGTAHLKYRIENIYNGYSEPDRAGESGYHFYATDEAETTFDEKGSWIENLLIEPEV